MIHTKIKIIFLHLIPMKVLAIFNRDKTKNIFNPKTKFN